MLAVYAWMAPRLENRDWFLPMLAVGGWEWGRESCVQMQGVRGEAETRGV